MLAAAAACLPGAAFVVAAQEEAARRNSPGNSQTGHTNNESAGAHGSQAVAAKGPTRTPGGRIGPQRSEEDLGGPVGITLGDGFAMQTDSWKILVRKGRDMALQSGEGGTQLQLRDGECEFIFEGDAHARHITLRADELSFTIRRDRETGELQTEVTLRGDVLVRQEDRGPNAFHARVGSLRAERLILTVAGTEFRMRAESIAGMEVDAKGERVMNELLRSRAEAEGDPPPKTTPILGQVVDGEYCDSFSPPSDQDILKVLGTQEGMGAQSLANDEYSADDIRIVKEKLADYVDGPCVIPLLGRAQLHHARYKCTVFVGRQRHVLHVDHQHIHVLGGEKAKVHYATDSPNAARPMNEPRGVHIGHLDVRRLAVADAEWQKLLAEQNVRQRLNQPVEVNFHEVPLEQALDGIAESIGINVVVDEEGLREADPKADAPVTLDLSQPVPARAALQVLLAPRHLGYAIDGDALKVTSAERARGMVYLIAYRVSDLVTPIAGFVRDRSADGTPDAWRNVGGVGRIVASPENMCLVVGQTEDVHDQIADLIHRLHELGKSHLLLDVKVIQMPADAPSKGTFEGILRKSQEAPCVLDADQRSRIIDASQKDRQTRILQHQVVVRNGQQVILPLGGVDRQESATDARLALLPIVNEGTSVSLGAGFRKGQGDDDAIKHHDVPDGRSLLLQGEGHEGDKIMVIVSFSRH